MHEYYGSRFDPKTIRLMTDFIWYGSVRLSAVMVLSALLLGGWFLFDAQFASRGSGEGQGVVETVNRTALSGVLEQFSQKQLRYEALRRTAPSIVDPAR